MRSRGMELQERVRATLEVGPAPELVVRDGDRLRVTMAATGDLSVSIWRDRALVLAIGAVEDLLAAASCRIEWDPRLHEQYFPYLHTMLTQRSKLVWLDPHEPDVDARIETWRSAHEGQPPAVIVVRSDSRETARDINHRLFGHSRRGGPF